MTRHLFHDIVESSDTRRELLFEAALQPSHLNAVWALIEWAAVHAPTAMVSAKGQFNGLPRDLLLTRNERTPLMPNDAARIFLTWPAQQLSIAVVDELERLAKEAAAQSGCRPAGLSLIDPE